MISQKNTVEEINIVPIYKHQTFSFDALLATMNKIKLPTNIGFELFAVSDIVYLEAQSNYTTVHLLNGKALLITKTLKLMEAQLPAKLFVRIHKSYLVNGMYIKSLSSSREHTLTLEQNIILPIARSKVHIFT
jgi:two-component system, LytTR family, response regulator